MGWGAIVAALGLPGDTVPLVSTPYTMRGYNTWELAPEIVLSRTVQNALVLKEMERRRIDHDYKTSPYDVPVIDVILPGEIGIDAGGCLTIDGTGYRDPNSRFY